MPMLHPFSLVIPAVVLFPNVAYVLARPHGKPPAPPKEPVVLSVLERAGQACVTVAPIFSAVTLDDALARVTLAAAAGALALYYACWLRYFLNRREYRLLFSPMWRIPVPMALLPVAYFLLISGPLHSLIVLISALLLAAGHIPITLIRRRQFA